MTLLTFLKTIFGYSPTSTAKSSDASSAEESIRAEELETSESVPNVSESKPSSEVYWMTETKAKGKLVDWCKSQVGYHEGYDGSNKYADGDWDTKLYGFSALNVPWCDVFVDAAYITCFGFNDATAMTYQQPSGYAACSLSADAYKRNGAFYNRPEVGDQIFFYYGNGINHTGIVIDVQGDTVYCVEGNYSDGVARTQYKLDNNIIAGYGRPNWAVVAEPETVDGATFEDDNLDIEQFDIVHPAFRRTYIHLSYGDGLQSNGQLPAPQVKAWQNLLLCWGYDVGRDGADGEFGFDTENATRQWQQYVSEIGGIVEVNGVVDEDDWVEILNVPG